MEIALLILLFLVGTVASAMQAMKYLERRSNKNRSSGRNRQDDP